MPGGVLGHFAAEWGSRSNQAHLSARDVPQLWKLVERGTAQKPPDTGHARVALHLEGVTVDRVERSQVVEPLLRVRAHGAELHHSERPPVQPDPLLPKERSTGRVQLDEHSKKCEETRR